MNYMSLGSFYQITRALKRHKYSINEVEEMYPYERDIHVSMITEEIENQERE